MKFSTALVALMVVSSTAAAQGTFHGNVARTGVYEGGGPAQAPAVKWTFKAAGPIVTSPAIAGGRRLHREHERAPVCARPGNGTGKMELQVEPADRLVAHGG